MNILLYNKLLPYREWLKGFDHSPETDEKHLRFADKFLRFSGKSLNQITKQDVLKYRDALTKQFSSKKSVNPYLSSLNKLLYFLKKDSFKLRLFPLKPSTYKKEALSGEQYAALLECAKSSGNMRLYYILRIFASSGIRYRELVHITPNMLNSGLAFASIRNQKREIIVPDTICADLKHYCTQKGLTGDDIIFHGLTKGVLLDKGLICRQMKALAERAGVPRELVYAQNLRQLLIEKYMARFNNAADLADILGFYSKIPGDYIPLSGREKQARINEIDSAESA
ncbi:MAG: hypothetical protein LBT01_04430 [Spirochaetaceae bacterium]|jgi:integrase|nr:hypothetical protein [Spirochaetaceae bacterium]